MVRLSIIIALFVSLFAIARGIEVGVRQGDLPDVALRAQKQSSSATGNVVYYPPPPESMPDLMEGYLFNPERLLEEEAEEEAPPAKESMAQAAAIEDFEQVQYSGSVIMDNQRLALIKFPLAAPKAAKKRSKPGQRRRPKKKSSKVNRSLQNIQVKQGEIFRGFTVTEISPERIVFERDADKITKYLYDKNKKRTGRPSKVAPKAPAVGKRRVATTKSKVQIPARKTSGTAGQATRRIQPSRIPRRTFNRTKRPRPTVNRTGVYKMLEQHPDLMAPPSR